MHIGKASGLILVAVLIGGLVLYKNDPVPSAADLRDAADAALTTTTLASSPDDFTDTTQATTAREPATVKVIAINATGKAGIAGRATTRLTGGGYNAVAPGNSTAAYKANAPTTVVFVVTAGYDAEAAAIAALFGLPASVVQPLPSPSPSTDIKGVDVALVVGSDLNI